MEHSEHVGKVLKNLRFVIWDISRDWVRKRVLSVSLPCTHHIVLFKKWPVVAVDGWLSAVLRPHRGNHEALALLKLFFQFKIKTNKQNNKSPTKSPKQKPQTKTPMPKL